MHVILRFNVPEGSKGKHIAQGLVDAWLDDKDITIQTHEFSFSTRLTYVKESVI